MKRLPCKFQIGTTVYHRMDDGPGLVVEIRFKGNGEVTYGVQWSATISAIHFEMELSTARTFTTVNDDSDTIEK